MTSREAFDRLHPVIQHHIVNTLGWNDLRPLQADSVAPLVNGDDALLLAPTAGGKTEAALFPLLTRAASEGWQGTSILYICPLRALLNNLQPRVHSYASWFGGAAAVRHGDTSAGNRRRIALDQPTVLMTTPESLEAMLVSRTIDPRILLANVKAVIIDEVHAFAGDDRGWHLLAVLERIASMAGRRLQRVGLSATVGNADELLGWLQGSDRGMRPARVIDPPTGFLSTPAIELDYVGSVANAAKVIAALHRGEKRLVFAESRARVEELAHRLNELGTETYVSHSSLSVEERRRAEQAFAEARDCVIVSTSTLELGIDVGDLDRVIQVGAPTSVASFLQRLGRTGRRPGGVRNMLFLAIDDDDLIGSAAVLLLWSEGFVEPISPPPTPRHLVAQQLLALALQQHQVGRATWIEALNGLSLAPLDEVNEITEWMIRTQHLDVDGGMLFVGPEAERKYGFRHFMEIMAIFAAAPQFVVINGRREIGSLDPYVVLRKVSGPRFITLAGRGWRVMNIDWTRRRAYVEVADSRGPSRWISVKQPRSFELTQAERRVLLGEVPDGVMLSSRAKDQLRRVIDELSSVVDREATVAADHDGRNRWWTWAGGKANAILVAGLEDADPSLIDDSYSYDNRQIALGRGVSAAQIRDAVVGIRESLAAGEPVRPFVSQRAVDELKFSDMLPPDMARQTLEQRLVDAAGARTVASSPVRSAQK